MRTVFLLAILLLAPPAMSCGCSAPKSISDVDSGSIIFKGRVKSVEPKSETWSATRRHHRAWQNMVGKLSPVASFNAWRKPPG